MGFLVGKAMVKTDGATFHERRPIRRIPSHIGTIKKTWSKEESRTRMNEMLVVCFILIKNINTTGLFISVQTIDVIYTTSNDVS